MEGEGRRKKREKKKMIVVWFHGMYVSLTCCSVERRLCWLSALSRATFDLFFLPVFPGLGLAVVLGSRRGGWVVFQVPGFLTDYPSCGCLGDIFITRLLKFCVST